MYLKSVEIVGFKSFADKTRLEFKPGITGIIGPNGCGKSNVMESIRWCIGERSWKSLRSTSMVDVIFAGTAKRSPMSLAEVTLTFDNAASMLPVQYSEVTVSRRLFRSGESEYWLNKTQCRLRDVAELFLDTGLGGDGYAIIDQGGVAFVLNSKPEERRALFEEAAGVSKYKAKREEAVRKLERVEADLARLGDSIALINEQIKKLDSDARKAKLYQKYKEELAAMEAGQILQEAGSIAAELDRESELARPVQEELGRLATELSAEEARHSAVVLERSSVEGQVLESNQKIAALKSEIGRLDERIANARAQAGELKGRQETARSDSAHETSRLAELDPQIDAAAAAADASKTKWDAARAELDGFAAESASIEAAVEAARNELERLRAELLTASQSAVMAGRSVSDLESRLSHRELDLRGTAKERARSAARAETCRAEAESLLVRLFSQRAWADDAVVAREAVEAERRRAVSRRAEIDEQSLTARAELAALSARAEALEAQGAQDPYWVGAHAVWNAGIPGVLGTVRSLLKVPKNLARPVEDALGERLYAVVCEDLSAAKASIEFLRASAQGRARLLVLSSLPETAAPMAYPPQAKPLIDQVSCEPRFEPVLRHLLAECYSLGGALYGSHWVCGGSEAAEATPLKLSDLKALRGEIAGTRSACAALANSRAAADAAIAALDARAAEAAKAANEEAARLNVLEGSQREREESLRLCEVDLRGLDSQAASIETDLTTIRESISAAQAGLASFEEREKTLRENEAAAVQALEERRHAAAGRQARKEALEAAVGSAEREHALLRDQSDRLAMEKEKLEDALARRKAAVEELAVRMAENAHVEAASRLALDGHHRDLAVLETEAQGLFARQGELLQAAQQLDGRARRLKADAAERQERLHQWEVKASGLKARQDSLKSRLWDEWQLTWEEASTKYAQQAVDPEKIQTLRKRIQNMGNINMAAPEEYEALTQRHGFLQTQVDDLAKAKDDLRAAISKINATTRENFRQTFTEVREHFRRIFSALFEGGEADLVLTDQENLLETGVEIVAQPPGKRLQSITLLSGGEKTMTAIALLFSFFMVKPSPVCMLDEADAALDEANIERFVAMLKEFAGKSQFLIVSHSKRTMEAAETIYGVTMEESGVSMTMSVDFRKRADSPAPPVPEGASEAAP